MAEGFCFYCKREIGGGHADWCFYHGVSFEAVRPERPGWCLYWGRTCEDVRNLNSCFDESHRRAADRVEQPAQERARPLAELGQVGDQAGPE